MYIKTIIKIKIITFMFFNNGALFFVDVVVAHLADLLRAVVRHSIPVIQ